MNLKNFCTTLVGLVLAMAMFVPFAGCDRKETLMDVETPNGELEVERDVDSGAVEVDVNSKN